MAPIKYPHVTLDVFTSTAYSGNPLAAVFLPTPDPLSQSQKQLVAKEFNLSETIFFHAPTDRELEQGSRKISIFTTGSEIPFAGHPTIGATSWLLVHSEDEDAAPKPTSVITKAGPIPISLSDRGSGYVKAAIPHNMHLHRTPFPLEELLRLHPSMKPHLSERVNNPEQGGGFPIVSIVKGMTAILIAVPSLKALAAVTTASGGEAVPSTAVGGVKGGHGGYLDEGWDYKGHLFMYFYVRSVEDEALGREVIRSRMTVASLEDPATGSAASSLTTYLASTEEGAKEREYNVVQGVEMGRRSNIGIRVILKDVKGERGPEIDKVELSGGAVLVSEGTIRV